MIQNYEIAGTIIAIIALFWWLIIIAKNQRDELKRSIRILLSPSEAMYALDLKNELQQRGTTVTDRTLHSVIREMVEYGEITRIAGILDGPNQPISRWRLLVVITPRPQ